MVWPLSSRRVAFPGRRPAWRSHWEWRKLWLPAALAIPAASTALHTAFWTRVASRLRLPSCRHSGLSSPGPVAVAPCPSLPPDHADGSRALASAGAGAVPTGCAAAAPISIVFRTLSPWPERTVTSRFSPSRSFIRSRRASMSLRPPPWSSRATNPSTPSTLNGTKISTKSSAKE